MAPTPVQIVDVLSAGYNTLGTIDCDVVIEGAQQDVINAAGAAGLETNGQGTWRATVPYTYNPNEEYDNAWNVAGWFRDHPDFPIDPYVAPPEPEPVDLPLALTQIACARLLVDEWDVTGVERSSGLSVAFVADTDTVWAFFNEPQPDTYYVVMPDDGVTKHEDYLEITRPGLASINLVVSRVQ